MCKMAVTNEALNYKQYQMLQFPEFLEFIGRLADFKFKNSPEMAQNSLFWKIENLLEDMMPAFNMVKNDVNKE